MITALMIVLGVVVLVPVIGVGAFIVLELFADDAQRSGRNWFL